MGAVVAAAAGGFALGVVAVTTAAVALEARAPQRASTAATRARVRPQTPGVLAPPLAAAEKDGCSACGGGGRARCAVCDGAGRLNGERAVLTRGVWPLWCKECRGSGRTACPQCWGAGKRRGQLGFMD